MSEYRKPKAQKIYVDYDVDDPDDLFARRTIEQIAENINLDDGDGIVAVYQFVGLVRIEKISKLKVTKIEE